MGVRVDGRGPQSGRLTWRWELASLAYACLFTLSIWLILHVPYRRRWFVRV